MAALRERYPARDGMGYANRPWLHNALRLDAQSRRLCLSSARGCESNTNTNCVAECYSYSYCHAYSNSDGYSNSNSYCYRYPNSNTRSETYSHTKATPHAAAATISP